MYFISIQNLKNNESFRVPIRKEAGRKEGIGGEAGKEERRERGRKGAKKKANNKGFAA